MRSLAIRSPYSLVAYPLEALDIVVAGTGVVLCHTLGLRKASSWFRKKAWASLTIKFALANVEIEGLEHLNHDGSLVLTPNHQGVLEYPIFHSRFQRRPYFLAKANMAKIPFFGQAMVASGTLFIHREDGNQAVTILQQEEQAIIDRKKLIVDYPEGTRTRDPQHRIGPFKKGPFVLAIRTQSPVVPMVITGIADFLPADHWLMNPAPRIRMKILPPIPTRGMTYADRDRLRDEVRDLMIKTYLEMGGTGGMPP